MKFKIITVSGCANCPFLQVWNDENGNLLCGTCTHNSFNKELGEPQINIEVLTDGNGYNKPTGMPEWCPLD
jgi:hypothetical protein